MQPTVPHLPPLAEYRDPPEVQDGLKDYYPTKQSFSWFARRNRVRLVETGALIIVAGRMKFHPKLTEEVIKEAGHQAALGGGD